MNKKTKWKHSRQKVKVSGNMRQGYKLNAISTNMKPTKRKPVQKSAPKFNKKAFLKLALPFVGIKNKRTNAFISAVLSPGERGPGSAYDNEITMYVVRAVRESESPEAVFEKMNLAIRELRQIMELAISFK